MSSLADQEPTRVPHAAKRRRDHSPTVLGAIFAGGMAGALARALLARALPAGHGDWPWATFAVNIGGSLLLGYVVTRLQERLPPSTFRRPFLGTGFCGALTTFSTFQVELLQLARDGNVGLLTGYAAASIAGCFAAVQLATALTRRAHLR